jgi:hypothetical protein
MGRNFISFWVIVWSSVYISESTEHFTWENMAQSSFDELPSWPTNFVDALRLQNALEVVIDGGCASRLLHWHVGGQSQVGDWAHSNEEVDFVLKITEAFSKGCEHLGCSLGVTDPGYLVFTGSVSDEINLGWGVILGKLKVTVIEELVVVFGATEGVVLSRVLGTSVVTKPDIVASMGSLEGWRTLLRHNPGIS